jgi:Mce-associated membrane protein
MVSKNDRSTMADTDPDDELSAADALALAEAEAAEAEAMAAAARARARAIRLRRQAAESDAVESAEETEEADEADTVDAVEPADTNDTADAEESETADEEPDEAGAEEPAPKRNRWRWVRHLHLRIAVPVVAVLAICALVTVTVLMILSHQKADQQRQRVAEFAAAARQGVVTLMSIDFTKAKDDVQRIIDNSTGQFKQEFQSQADDMIKASEASKVVTTASVSSTAVQSISGDSAVVLVAARSEVTNTAGAKNDPRTWRLSVTVSRDGNQLKMSRVEFVP